MAESLTGRLSGGFSLDEAGRLYRGSAPGTTIECPHCGGPMREVIGERPRGSVWLVRCDSCGRGLVFDGPPSVK